MRNIQKEYTPVNQEHGFIHNPELDELERYKMKKQKEEYDILMNQK